MANNEERIINYEVLKRKLKWQSLKLKAKEVYADVKDWAMDHPKEALAGAALVLGGIDKMHKRNIKYRQLEQERHYREETVYDPSQGCRYTLRRPMKTKEHLEYERRLANGENRGAILNSMGLLRY